ncbi:MAG TPA: dTDP-4-dehydrorhamnose reductase [Chitinophagales bacterium]|nr:dTDP-4-dehydrorhamnose reductase [Chitinophagales bacterium]HRK25850.1 dTDP-4-dehydrorhamnose reductase [Chitinophagales bacterium]
MNHTKRTVLVTGANGQLGLSLQQQVAQLPDFPFRLVFLTSQNLNITQKQQVEQVFLLHKPFAVINCAAYTQVDKAESEPHLATLVNEQGAMLLATYCRQYEATLVQISSDFVFNGNANTPYTEEIPVSPIGIYAQTKANAETLTLQHSPSAVIVRTSWVYAPFGNNFVKTMLRLGAERPQLNVVFDQTGSPTYAPDLADALLQILLHRENLPKQVVFNYANTGIASWFDLATETIALAKLNCKVLPILTHQYPTAAKRPAYSVLDTHKIRTQLGLTIPYWRHSLQKCIRSLLV